MARAVGLPGLYLVAEMSDLLGHGPAYSDADADGFDAAVYVRLPAVVTASTHARMRVMRKAMGGGPEIYPYSDTIVAESVTGPRIHPCVYPNWDNTPRSGRGGLALVGATPEKFRRNVVAAVETIRDRPRTGAPALGEVLERVGRGQPPGTRPPGRPWLARGAARRAGHGCLRLWSSAPLRIAMISYYLPSGSKIGVGYQVHELATELVRRGHTVDVISECPPVPDATYGHHRVVLSGSMRTFRFATQLRRVDLSGYDVLHAHGDDYWMWRRRVPRHVRTSTARASRRP